MVLLGMLVVGVWAGAAGEGVGAVPGLLVVAFETEAAAVGAILAGLVALGCGLADTTVV